MNIDESRILITGGSGRLGKACKKIFPEAIYSSCYDLDVTDTGKIERFFASKRPIAVLHLAAIADIRKCEQDKSAAYAVNVQGTRNLIQAASRCTETGIFIFLNSACIFSGEDTDKMYDEDSIPDPKHYYGVTKALAEEVVRGHNSDHLQAISVRTNFTTMPWEHEGAFVDRFGTYLFAQGVAVGLREILESKPKREILHLCGDRKLSMYEYAKAGHSNVRPITLADYNGPKLTKNMCLTTKYWKKYRLEDQSPSDD